MGDPDVMLFGHSPYESRFERYVCEGGSSRDFFVLLLLASEAGHAQRGDWMTESSRSGHYPGIPPSPSRFLELDRVAVNLDPSSA